MKFLELLTYLSADPELEERNRQLIEQKKAELGIRYAHHKKNHVKRKDGLGLSVLSRHLPRTNEIEKRD